MSSIGYPVRMGNKWVSWYEYGHSLFECKVPCPSPTIAHPHLIQGYMRAARDRLAFQLSCMREKQRQGKFEFLPKYSHLASAKLQNI
jgi:hypothetical protein